MSSLCHRLWDVVRAWWGCKPSVPTLNHLTEGGNCIKQGHNGTVAFWIDLDNSCVTSYLSIIKMRKENMIPKELPSCRKDTKRQRFSVQGTLHAAELASGELASWGRQWANQSKNIPFGRMMDYSDYSDFFWKNMRENRTDWQLLKWSSI